jgi:ABC-type hemin transport system substrate-binding protein
MTDSFRTLGLGRCLVGVTDYCEKPDLTQNLVRVGGVKDARLKDILALTPDLVILNEEENSAALGSALTDAGIDIWLTFPRTVSDALSDLREIALAYPEDNLLPRIVWLERAVSWLENARTADAIRVFCPIWREEDADHQTSWMTFGPDTYANDVLTLCGGENVFAKGKTDRYPRISREDLQQAEPECVLLPSEPFSFQAEDASTIQDVLCEHTADHPCRILRVDGRLLFWHGTRLGESIRQLPYLLRSPDGEPKA